VRKFIPQAVISPHLTFDMIYGYPPRPIRYLIYMILISFVIN
jgi:hypothetical protein